MPWLSRRTAPNLITAGRIVLIAPFVILLVHMDDEPPLGLWARRTALALFCFMAASDALDGLLARRWRAVSSLGRFLDPLADKLLVDTTVLLLATGAAALEGFRIPPGVVVLVIGKDVLVVAGALVLFLDRGSVPLNPRAMGKAATALQLGMIAAVLLAPDLPPAAAWWMTRVLWWSAAAAAALAALDYLFLGLRTATGEHAEHDSAAP